MARSRALASTRASVAVLLATTSSLGCGFPEHTFIPDDQFDHPDAAGATTGSGGSGALGGSGGSTAGSGGSSGSSGGTGGQSTGGTGGTGANTGGEDCTNGSDDDADSLVDCADSNCQAVFTCAPALPTDWEGPVALWSGSGAAPECVTAGGFPTQKESASDGLSAQPASCPTCDCSDPSGGTCPSTVDLIFYINDNCGGASYQPVTLTSGAACAVANLSYAGAGGPAKSARYTANVSGSASCTPQPTGTLTLPPPTWATGARACGDAPTTGGGCGSGMCVPKPNAPFGSELCVYQAGDTACPAGPYTKKQLFYKSFTEGRSCTSCSCGAASGQSCGTVRTYTDPCTTGTGAVTLTPGVCSNVPADTTPGSNADSRYQAYTAGVPSGGSCIISGGLATGSVTAASPITFCCL